MSQDCDHRQTADVIARYGNELLHVKVYCLCAYCFAFIIFKNFYINVNETFSSSLTYTSCNECNAYELFQQPDQSDIEIPPKEKKFRGYFKIARHYKWALNKVFVKLGYSTAIIVEG